MVVKLRILPHHAWHNCSVCILRQQWDRPLVAQSNVWSCCAFSTPLTQCCVRSRLVTHTHRYQHAYMHLWITWQCLNMGKPIEYQFKREHHNQSSNFVVTYFRTNPHDYVYIYIIIIYTHTYTFNFTDRNISVRKDSLLCAVTILEDTITILAE